MTNKTRFVVDTNTLVSAVLVEGSTPDRALRKARARGVLLVFPDTLDEAVEALASASGISPTSYDGPIWGLQAAAFGMLLFSFRR